MSVIISTSYMDEAQQWDWIVAMDASKVPATGAPAELMARTGTRDLEKRFIELLPEEKRTGHVELTISPRPEGKKEVAVDAKGLTRRFGDFVAVDHVTLTIERGEIFATIIEPIAGNIPAWFLNRSNCCSLLSSPSRWDGFLGGYACFRLDFSDGAASLR